MGHKRLALGADSCLTQVVAGRLRVDTFCHFLCVCLATLTHVVIGKRSNSFRFWNVVQTKQDI